MERLITNLVKYGWPLWVLYIVSMVIIPVFAGDWEYTQRVWDRWQGLNVGVLALTSTLFVAFASVHKSEKQRARDFLAAKASLPSALSELCQFTKLVHTFYSSQFYAYAPKDIETLEFELSFSTKVIEKCISHAEPDEGEALANLLRQLQIVTARAHSSEQEIDIFPIKDSAKLRIMEDLVTLISFRASINRLFPFARSQQKLDNSRLTLDEKITASNVLNIDTEGYVIHSSTTETHTTLQKIIETRHEAY